jgi:protein-tyrosine kinase
VLFSGPLPPNPSELLSSPKIAELIEELASDHDMVIVDSPPLNPVADAQVLLDNPAVHAVLLVARAGKTTRDEAHRAKAILDRHLVEPVGLVVTGLRDGARYGYESYGPARRAGTEAGKPAQGLAAKQDALPRSTAASTPVAPAHQL